MRVLHIIKQGQHGGCENHLLNLITQLQSSDLNHKVVLFEKGVLADHLNEMGISAIIVPTNGFFKIASWWKIARLCKKWKIELIHACGSKACFNALFASLSRNLPLVYNVQGWAFQNQSRSIRRWFLQKLEFLLAKLAALNLVVTENDLELGREKLGMKRAKLVPFGLDLSRFSPKTKSTLSKAQLGIPEHAVVAGFLAQFTDQKDPLTLVKAMSVAAKGNPNLHLLMVGNGPLLKTCKKESRNLGIENRITFRHPTEKVEDYLALCDIYCLPSKWENLPMGALEAMAMEKPVICNAITGVNEIIAHQVDGLLVKNGDAEEWAVALLELCANPDLRNELGKRARLVVSAQYDIRKNSQTLSTALYSVAVSKFIAAPNSPFEVL